MSLGRNLRRFCESHGAKKTGKYFSDALREGRIRQSQISIRDLAESLLGPSWPQRLQGGQALLREANEAVDVSAFSNITGQLLVNEIQKKYESADFIGLQLCETIPITNGNLGSQKVPWLSKLSQAPKQLQPLEQYPHAQFSEQWITYPAPKKYGLNCAVSMEMIFADLTNQVFESAGDVGERLGQQQEEDILSVVLGLTNNHTWNDTSYNTYLTSGSWVNVVSGVTLTDWTVVNQVEQKFVEITDPVTAKPIKIKPDAMLVMPWRYYNAKRVLSATETRSGDITTGDGNQTVANNPLETAYPVLKSPNAYKLLTDSGVSSANAREYWYLGQFKKAFVWRQVYPLKVVEAPPNNPAEFNQDIAYQVKAGLFGAPGVRDPRYVCKVYNS